jgi:hypothetical protein
MAPAHKLLLAIQGKELAGTPRILGAGQEGNDWFYVIERLPDAYILMSSLLEKPDAHKLLSAETLQRLVEASTSCFRTIGRFDHIYTDFCSKNFMVNSSTKDVKLIDLDSAWSYEMLLKCRGTPTGDFERQYWCLWHDYVLQKHSGRPIPEYVPITMVLSLASVWARGLGLIKKSSHKQSEVLAFLRHTGHDTQRPLFEALEHNSKYAFLEYFGLDDQADRLFEEWRDIFRELTSGRFVNWSGVRQATTDLAAYYPPQKTPVMVIQPLPKTYIQPPPYVPSPDPSQHIPLTDATKRTKRSKTEIFFDPLGFFRLANRYLK